MKTAAFLLLALVACADRTSATPPTDRTAANSPTDLKAAVLPAQRIVDEQSAFDKARAEHKGVMIVFEATWCNPCLELDKNMRDAQVAPLVDASFVPLTLDVSNGTDRDAAVQDKYGAKTLPHIVFAATNGEVVGRVDRLLDPPELANAVRASAARIPH
jgi:thiol:disulfide interchange protein